MSCGRSPNSSFIPHSALPRCVRVWRRHRRGRGEHPPRPSLCPPPCKFPPPSAPSTTTRAGLLKELPSTMTGRGRRSSSTTSCRRIWTRTLVPILPDQSGTAEHARSISLQA
jgi:hypothetical protein